MANSCRIALNVSNDKGIGKGEVQGSRPSGDSLLHYKGKIKEK